MRDLARLAVEDFAARVGEPFTLPDGTEFELLEATALTSPGREHGTRTRRAPFSLTFAGPPDRVRPQAIHVLSNAELGTFEIFLVPIGLHANTVRYEAVFG